jgi:hypothetical protein
MKKVKNYYLKSKWRFRREKKIISRPPSSSIKKNHLPYFEISK